MGEGTTVTATFTLSHVHRMPIGDVEGTVSVLIHMKPDLDFVYRRSLGEKGFTLDTRELREVLEGVPLNTPDVNGWINEFLSENLKELKEA